MNNSTNNNDLDKLLKSIQDKKAHLSSINRQNQSATITTPSKISSGDQLVGFIKNSLQSLMPNLSKCEHFFTNIKNFKNDLIIEFQTKKISSDQQEEFFELVKQTEDVFAGVNFKRNNLETVITHNQVSVIQNNWNNFYSEYQVFLADFAKIRLFLLKNEIIFDMFVGLVAEKDADKSIAISLADIEKKNHLQEKRKLQKASFDAISAKLEELVSEHDETDEKNMNAALMIKNFTMQVSHIQKTIDKLDQKFIEEISNNRFELATETIEQIDMEISFLQTGVEQLAISLNALLQASNNAREKTGKIIPQNTAVISLENKPEENASAIDNALLLTQGEQKNKLLNYIADARMKLSQIKKSVAFVANDHHDELPEYKKQLLVKLTDSLHIREKELNVISELVDQGRVLYAKSELEAFKVNLNDLEKMHQLFNDKKDVKPNTNTIVPIENSETPSQNDTSNKKEESKPFVSAIKDIKPTSSELTIEIALKKDDKVILDHKKTLEKILSYLNELRDVIHLNHVAIQDYEKNSKFQEFLGKELTSETFKILKSHIEMQEKFIKVIDNIFKPVLESKEIDSKKLAQEEKTAQELIKIIFEDVINFVDQAFECLNIDFIKPPKKEKEISVKKRLKMLESNQKDVRKHLEEANELNKEYVEKTSKFRSEHPLLDILFENYSSELSKLIKELTKVSQLDNEKDLEQVIFANNFAELLWTKNDSLIFERMNEKFLKKIIM